MTDQGDACMHVLVQHCKKKLDTLFPLMRSLGIPFVWSDIGSIRNISCTVILNVLLFLYNLNEAF